LAGLRSAGQLTAEAAAEGPRPAFAGTVYRDADARRWQELDLAALARHGQFLAIAAA
jgi:twitching motility protein PilI